MAKQTSPNFRGLGLPAHCYHRRMRDAPTMKTTLPRLALPKISCAVAVIAVTAFVTARSDAAEPLKVFILAGQSNMVGHARAHTIATLYASDQLRDQKLLQTVIE